MGFADWLNFSNEMKFQWLVHLMFWTFGIKKKRLERNLLLAHMIVLDPIFLFLTLIRSPDIFKKLDLWKVWIQIKLNWTDGLRNHSRAIIIFQNDTILKGFNRPCRRKFIKVFKPKDKCNVGCGDNENFVESAGACSRPGSLSNISLMITAHDSRDYGMIKIREWFIRKIQEEKKVNVGMVETKIDVTFVILKAGNSHSVRGSQSEFIS